MKKLFLLNVLIICLIHNQLSAQQPKATTSEKVKNATQKVSEKTSKIANDVQEAANNVTTSVNNVKSILKVFEPFWLHIKGTSNVDISKSDNANNTQNTPNTEGGTPVATEVNSTTAQPTENMNTNTSASTMYNNDGTANWGCQDHEQYGCYLDAQKGLVMDDVDVAAQTGSVDVIFTASSYAGKPLYSLLSPQYAKMNTHARVYFTGEKYKKGDYPTKQWDVANATSIAEVRITGAQFDKVKDNNQLMAVVNQNAGFKDALETNQPLKGRVFAVRTQLDNRTTYALIYVVDQFGTKGSSAYLKVKLKVNGVDNNGDGFPDDTN